MNSKNIKINSNIYVAPDAVQQMKQNETVGFYATFSRFANLFIGNIKFVDIARLGLNVEQHSQLQSKSLAVRDIVDSRGLGKTQDILDRYYDNKLSSQEIGDIIQLAEEIVLSKEALKSLKVLSDLFREIFQSLPSGIYPFNTHRTLINAFVVSMTNFIYAAELHSNALKSSSIEVKTAATTKIFSCNENFLRSFKGLNDFYCDNRFVQ